MKRKTIIGLVIATILSTLIVFIFSSQNGTISYGISGRALIWLRDMGLYVNEFTLRKIAHIIIYFVLGVTSTALGIVAIRTSGVWRYVYGVTTGIGFCYICAFLDEWNQSRIVGRTGKLSDVGPDAIGFVTGSLVIALLLYWWEKKHHSNEKNK